MLLNYNFSNFRSFRNDTNFSMIATSQRTLNQNLIRKNDLRILPSAVIYGANASGKSNFILSLDVMRDIIVAGSVDADTQNLKEMELYPFAHKSEIKPMKFMLDFVTQGFRYEYGFSLEVTPFMRGSRRIISEHLTCIDRKGGRIALFSRDGQKVNINSEERALQRLNVEAPLLAKLEKRINDNLDDTELFLSRAFKGTISNDIADQVISFFDDNLMVISDFAESKSKLAVSSEHEIENDYYIWNKFIDSFAKLADAGPQQLSYRLKKTDSKEPQNTELISIYEHGGRHISIPAKFMESRGTIKMLDFLLPFMKVFEEGGVLVLDEFDASIHPEMIKGILAVFTNQELNKTGAQLIFTTHNPIFLNNQVFRRDQIFFIEKDEDNHDSTLYTLADFGSGLVRNDHNYMINYFKGRYGALPFLDFAGIVREWSGSQDE